MRYALVAAILFVVTTCSTAEELPQATRVIEGPKTTFPQEVIPEGVKLLAAALESCHDINVETVRYTPVELQKAQAGDYVRFVFPKPLAVKVLRKKLDVSEAVFAGGVFWLRSGMKAIRCTKYEYDKMDRFQAWYRQTLPAD